MTHISSTIELVKLLPHKNCGECGETLCVTFSQQVLSGKANIESCHHLTDESKTYLKNALLPPVKHVVIGKTDRAEVSVGGERVLYRHELRFFNPTAIAINVSDKLSTAEIEQKVDKIKQLRFEQMDNELSVDLIAVSCDSNDEKSYIRAIKTINAISDLPMVLLTDNSVIMKGALEVIGNDRPLIFSATKDNWQAMAQLADLYKTPLVIEATLTEIEDLIKQVESFAKIDIILAPRSGEAKKFSTSLPDLIKLRTQAINEGCLGYPVMAFPLDTLSTAEEATWASALVAKYCSLIIINSVEPEAIFPLLTLRQSIYTDPTVPAVVNPGLYKEGKPDENSPVLLTGNFAMTYSMVSSDVRSANINAHLLVADAQGYSIGVACLLGTITAENIAALIDQSDIAEKVNHKKLIIPGLMEPLKSAIEEATKMEVLVGPIDSRFIPTFINENWNIAPAKST